VNQADTILLVLVLILVIEAPVSSPPQPPTNTKFEDEDENEDEDERRHACDSPIPHSALPIPQWQLTDALLLVLIFT
jgi:hypothetical protein